jgi:outer membrane protein TolC
MFARGNNPLLLLVLLALAAAPPLGGQEAPADESARERTASENVLASVPDPLLGEVVREILERNPGVAAAQARAQAAAGRAPQLRARPEPELGLTLFVKPPETRTGPQRLAASYSQQLGHGQLKLNEQAALNEAAALAFEVEAQRLSLVTEARRLHYELGFLVSYREISEELRAHLVQHEEISRARYSTGVGLGQSVLKLQAEITSAEKELLDIETRRVALEAQLNSLRDRPAGTPVPRARIPELTEITFEPEPLIQAALRLRPEIKAADSRIAQASVLTERAGREKRVRFKLGATYTVVDRREDELGQLMPPEGNGDDIFGVHGAIALPVWRNKLEAGLAEAAQLQAAALEAKRVVEASIESTIGDLALRVPLNWRQLKLAEDLLIVQAEESLESAQSGYVAGTLNALDLLDAEHVLFEAQTALARARADYLISLAELEGAVGAPLSELTAGRGPQS